MLAAALSAAVLRWNGELPNSFVKRQLGIPAGATAQGTLSMLAWALLHRKTTMQKVSPTFERLEKRETLTLLDLQASDELVALVRRCALAAGLSRASVDITLQHGWSTSQSFPVSASIFEDDIEPRADVEDGDLGDLYVAIEKCFGRLHRRRLFHHEQFV